MWKLDVCVIISALLATLCVCSNGYKEDCVTQMRINSETELNNTRTAMMQMDALYSMVVEGSECVINLTKYYSIAQNDLAVIRDKYEIHFSIVCEYQTNLDFILPDSLSSPQLKVRIGLFFEMRCVVSLDTLELLSNSDSTEITTLSFDASDQFTGKYNQTCTFANTLEYLATPVEKNTTGLLDMCSDSFISIVTLQLSSPPMDNGGATVPARLFRSLETRFPNLQQIDIVNLEIDEALTFPWMNLKARVGGKYGRKVRFVPGPIGKAQYDVLQREGLYDYERIFQYQTTTKDTPAISGYDVLHFNGSINFIFISGLAINYFHKDFFRYTKHLKTLNIVKNGLKTITKGQFTGLTTLMHLDISDNAIVSLDKDVFKDQYSLRSLYLNNNRLTKLSNILFQNCKQLELISLENNNLEVLTNQLFKPLFLSLQIIRIAFNPIRDIPTVLIYAPNVHSIDMHHTEIDSFGFINSISHLDYPDLSVRNAVNQFDNGENSLDQPVSSIIVRKLDVSFCFIQSLPFAQAEFGYGLQGLIRNFIVDFSGNPLDCACNITDLQSFLDMMNGNLSLTNFAASTEETLICDSPPHLKGKKVTSISLEEMYCPIDVPDCPSNCVCSRKEDYSAIIVDCNRLNITAFPSRVPDFTLELWFQKTDIPHIRPMDYFGDVIVLDIRNSKVNSISPSVFGLLKRLKKLYLASNLIVTIPIQITDTTLEVLTLSDNPYLCDCRLKWMKAWLLSRENAVTDWADVKCTDGSKKGKQLIAVEDTQFTCNVDTPFDSVQHVFFPSVIIGCVLVVILTLSLLIYFQEMTIKVFLFTSCGIHPFDLDITGGTNTSKSFDAIAVYDYNDMDFMQTHVVDYLSEKGFKVADMYRDFIVGLSFTENMKHFISQSRRLIMCISRTTLHDDLMNFAWNTSLEKALHTKTNFIILINNNCNVGKVKDKQIKRYLKSRRCIKRNSPMFQKYLNYFMPMVIERGRDAGPTVRNAETYIVYPDALHRSVRHELIPKINGETGIDVGLFEFQFLPGNDVAEEILQVMDRSQRLIYILSHETLRDEIKMVILKNAISKSMACDYNYLLLVTSGDIDEAELGRDLINYVNNHVTVGLEDPRFLERLTMALTTDYSTYAELDNHGIVGEGANIPLV